MFDGVQVDRVAIALVGPVDFREGQRADDEWLIFSWELVVGVILTVVAVVYFNRTELWQLGDEVPQVTSPLRIARIVGTGEAERILTLVEFDGIVHARLTGERQEIDAVMPQRGLVAMNTVHIGGENEIELLGGGQEGFEMNRVFLVPKHRGDAARLAPTHDLLQLAGIVANLAAPQFVFAAPGGLDEQQLRLEVFELCLPTCRGELLELGLGLIGTIGEVIHDAGNLELSLRHALRQQCGGLPGIGEHFWLGRPVGGRMLENLRCFEHGRLMTASLALFARLPIQASQRDR